MLNVISKNFCRFVIQSLRKPLRHTHFPMQSDRMYHISDPYLFCAQINAFMLRWLQPILEMRINCISIYIWYSNRGEVNTFDFANFIMTVLLLLFSCSHRHSTNHYSIRWHDVHKQLYGDTTWCNEWNYTDSFWVNMCVCASVCLWMWSHSSLYRYSKGIYETKWRYGHNSCLHSDAHLSRWFE